MAVFERNGGFINATFDGIRVVVDPRTYRTPTEAEMQATREEIVQKRDELLSRSCETKTIRKIREIKISRLDAVIAKIEQESQ